MYDHEAHRKLDEVLRLVRVLAKGELFIMGKLEDLAVQFDSETNAVAARIDKLQADLQTAISQGQPPSTETLQALSNISDRLKSLGQDPTNPIPPAPPPSPAPATPTV